MSNLLTDWREAVVAQLATQLPTVEVISGERDGVSRDKDRICVFWPGFGEDSGDVNWSHPLLTIRYFVARPKTALKDVPHDEAPLEQAAMNLMNALEPVQASLMVGQLYFRLTNVRPVRDQYAVEAQLLAWARNPATVA